MLRCALLIGVCLGVLSPSPALGAEPSADITPLVPSVDLPPELDRVLRDYEKGWQEKDAPFLAGLFAPDGFILRPGKPPVRGRAAIAEAYKHSGGPLSLRALDYAMNGTIAYIIGAFGPAPGDPDWGKFILTLRLENGRWFITADMDNDNS